MMPSDSTELINKELLPDEVLGVVVVRNEMIRLPSWLAHYRSLGVSRFVVIDNGSTDGTLEFTMGQDDCRVVQRAESFAESSFGIKWVNELVGALENPGWILFADADEQLVYRGWPSRSVVELCQEAEAEGNNAIFSFMMDMYPSGPLEDTASSGLTDLFALAPCFDRDYHFRLRPRKPWQAPDGWIEVVGGPRVRYLSSFPREVRSGWFDYLLRGQIDRVLPFVPLSLLPSVVRAMPSHMPVLAKYPLIRVGEGVRHLHPHWISGAKVHRDSTVVCHFKFLRDFADRVRVEIERREHYNRSAEYILYGDMLRKQGNLDFRYSGTARFSGSEQLVELGLIRDISSFCPFPNGPDSASGRKSL